MGSSVLQTAIPFTPVRLQAKPPVISITQEINRDDLQNALPTQKAYPSNEKGPPRGTDGRMTSTDVLPRGRSPWPRFHEPSSKPP